MRKIPKLVSPKFTDREFAIADFSKYEKTAFSSGEKGLKNGVTLQSIGNADGVNARRVYSVGDCVYAYCVDNSIKVYASGEWQTLTNSAVEPYVIPFKKDGEDCALIAGDNAVIRYGDGRVEQTQAPSGSCAVVYKDMLFVSNANRLSFSKLFDYQDFSNGIENAGFVKTDAYYGEILALIPTENSLVIVCERAIYHLYPIGERENYSLVKQDVALKAQRYSVKNAGDKTYIMSNGSLCKYQGGKLSKVDCGLDFSKYAFNGNAGVDGNLYYATFVGTDNAQVLFVYDGVTCEQVLINAQNVNLADGGYLLQDGVKRLIKDSERSLSWESSALDLGTPKIKTLTAIAVKSNTSVNVKVKCSYGSVDLKFNKGFNQIKTYLTDNAFTLNLTAENGREGVELIKLTYRLQEN